MDLLEDNLFFPESRVFLLLSGPFLILTTPMATHVFLTLRHIVLPSVLLMHETIPQQFGLIIKKVNYLRGKKKLTEHHPT